MGRRVRSPAVRAVLCKAFGPLDTLVVEEVADPQPAPGQIAIDVEACAVNFPDLLTVQGLYQARPALPYTPGSEVAGTVSAVGAGVTTFAPGDRVFASASTGGLAEQVVVDTGSAFHVPAAVDAVTASTFLYAYGTSYYALHERARLQPGETLLVLGAAGGVGLAAVELGAVMGATVIAAASSEAKLAVCRERGAHESIDYTSVDLKSRLKELTGGRGVDVVYDPVGGAYSEAALRSTAWEGRFLVIGFAAGEIARIPLNLPLLKGCSVVGVFWGSFLGREPDRARALLEELVGWWQDGKLRPHVSSTYSLEQAPAALRELAERRAEGKVVVVVRPS